MNKKYLIILISSILMLALLVFFNGECEMVIVSDYEDSPFGILDLEEMRTGDLTNPKDAGVKWVRLSGLKGMLWDKIERLDSNEQLGNSSNYFWDQTDALANELTQNGFNLSWTVNHFNRFDQGQNTPTAMAPNDLIAYRKFIKAAAERYDGDGNNDAPGSPVVNYWQIHNEVNVDFFWKDTPKAYAELLKVSYDAIKEANPNAKVAIAGMSNPSGLFEGGNSYAVILEELKKIGGTFDIFDVHWFGYVGNYKKHNKAGKEVLTEFMNVDLSNVLNDFNNVEVWFTEDGTHTGSDVDLKSGLAPAQSEIDQAGELVKRYIYPLANGVKKIFWRNVIESRSYSRAFKRNDYFDNIGLVYNGCGIEDEKFTCKPEGVGDDLGEGVKKLSYYTYKLMVEKLERSDWDNIQIINESDNIYI